MLIHFEYTKQKRGTAIVWYKKLTPIHQMDTSTKKMLYCLARATIDTHKN